MNVPNGRDTIDPSQIDVGATISSVVFRIASANDPLILDPLSSKHHHTLAYQAHPRAGRRPLDN